MLHLLGWYLTDKYQTWLNSVIRGLSERQRRVNNVLKHRLQVRSTLFNVEGLKVDESDETMLLVLSSLWLAMSKHLGLTADDLTG